MVTERQEHIAQCLVDTSDEFFGIRLRQCCDPTVLRRATQLEAAGPCRTERLSRANTRRLALERLPLSYYDSLFL